MSFRRLKAPITSQMEITYKCNHNCIYCYNYWRDDDNVPTHGGSEDEIISYLEKLGNAGIYHVTFTGGEP
ncbi:MAG: radical SAM protein, partial [Nanoarchaeota archaeon]|nr:radical SAM protein [Nanoarchaeota archaeon]